MKNLLSLLLMIHFFDFMGMEKPCSKRPIHARVSTDQLHKKAPAQAPNTAVRTTDTPHHNFFKPSGIFITKDSSKPASDTIWHAIERNDIDAVTEFIANGSVNIRYSETMHEDHSANGRIITNVVIKPEIENNTPLIHAATRGRLEIVKKLLAAGADPNAQNFQGQTALTSCNTHTNVMKELLNAGADPNIKAFIGHTALMYALMRRDLEQTLLLLNHGADPDITTPHGYTARWYAIEAGNQFIHCISTYTILTQGKIKKISGPTNIQQPD